MSPWFLDDRYFKNFQRSFQELKIILITRKFILESIVFIF